MSHSPSIDYTQNITSVYHVSEVDGIACFKPRPIRPDHPLARQGPAVWAIGARLLHNYLLPRDCPRVSFYAGAQTTAKDTTCFLGHTTASHIVAIEAGWLSRADNTTLYIYRLPATAFELADPTADYWLSTTSVTPLSVDVVARPILELTTRNNVELRIAPSLWPLYDALLASTLNFSMIRMSNATARPQVAS